MPTSQELREQRAQLISQARVIIDAADARELTAEEQAQVDGMFTQADQLEEQANSVSLKEKLARAEADLKESQGRRVKPGKLATYEQTNAHDRREALRAWCLAGTGRVTPDMLNRAANAGLDLSARSIQLRALSKGTNSAGGYSVPVELATEYEKKLKWYCPIRDVVKVFSTDTGADLDYPVIDDTSNSAAIVAEAGAIGSSTDPTFSKITFKAWRYCSPIVKVSLELLQDSNIDIEALLADLFAERMGRTQEGHFVTGDGTTQPEGLVTGATTAVNLASGNTLSFDKIIDLIHSVDRAYRQNGAFLTHDSTLAAIKKLKDSSGQYLWQPSTQAGEPDKVWGFPIYVSNSFAAYTGAEGDNAKMMLFGDFKKYSVRDVASSLSLARLDELYAANGQVGFLLQQRVDGRYVNASAVKALASYDAP